MPFQTLDRRARLLTLALVICLALTLAYGFLPMVEGLARILRPHLPFLSPKAQLLVDAGCFPALAAFFYFTLPGRSRRVFSDSSALVKMSVLPVLLALAFGVIRRQLFVAPHAFSWLSFSWFVLFVPLGEELLFRGWLFRLIEYRFPAGNFWTATNPLPPSIWMTSVAFSVWHLQNLGKAATLFVAFQIVYTFFTALWLGYLRYRSGKVLAPWMAHAAINLASLPF